MSKPAATRINELPAWEDYSKQEAAKQPRPKKTYIQRGAGAVMRPAIDLGDLIQAASKSRIQWNPSSKVFSERGNPRNQMRGVKSIIEQYAPCSMAVFKGVNRSKAHHSSSHRATSEPAINFMPGNQRDSHGCFTGVTDIEHGEIVDTQISEYARTPLQEREVFVKRTDLDACTVRGIEKLKELGLVPVASQVIVGDLEVGMATAIDLVCRDRNMQYVVIELKATKHTCFDWYKKAYGTMLPPLDVVPYSMKNRDLLQMLLTTMLLQRGLSRYTVKRAAVIRVGATVCEVFSPEEWCNSEELQDVLYSHIRANWLQELREREAARAVKQAKKDKTESNKRARMARDNYRPRKKTGAVRCFTPGDDL